MCQAKISMYLHIENKNIVINLDRCARIFIRRMGKQHYAVLGEYWAPIVCLRQKRYKEFLSEFYRGDEKEAELFLETLLKLVAEKESYVTVQQVVDRMKTN